MTAVLGFGGTQGLGYAPYPKPGLPPAAPQHPDPEVPVHKDCPAGRGPPRPAAPSSVPSGGNSAWDTPGQPRLSASCLQRPPCALPRTVWVRVHSSLSHRAETQLRTCRGEAFSSMPGDLSAERLSSRQQALSCWPSRHTLATDSSGRSQAAHPLCPSLHGALAGCPSDFLHCLLVKGHVSAPPPPYGIRGEAAQTLVPVTQERWGWGNGHCLGLNPSSATC